MSDTDAQLWARVRSGDDAGLAELFNRHQARLFRHACRVLTTREDAKDAMTIAFFELWRKRSSVRLVEGSPLPWLLNTVSYSAMNLERAGRRYRLLLSHVPAGENPEELLTGDETGVIAALRRLPRGEQSVLVLSVLEGYPHSVVADALGIPVGTVKSRLARAKSRLRNDLAAMEASWA